MTDKPWRAEHGALLHRDAGNGHIFTVSPPKYAVDVAKALNDAAALETSIDLMQKALIAIAGFSDNTASHYLEKTGSYRLFDEPGSVQIAREALKGLNDARFCIAGGKPQFRWQNTTALAGHPDTAEKFKISIPSKDAGKPITAFLSRDEATEFAVFLATYVTHSSPAASSAERLRRLADHLERLDNR